MAVIKKVQDKISFPVLEDAMHAFWEENKIFEKSVDQRSDQDLYKFIDGPPFVSGSIHYGHLLTSIAKDVIPRYWTMKGKKVQRIWGWDCHGLPIEQKVNQKLKISNKKEIEKIGVDEYIKQCKIYVEESLSNWKWYIDKVGRWVDMEHAYYTMNIGYMESVMWAFKQIYDKGLIYKGKRTSMFSTDTATPVSHFEVAMDADNYRDVEDQSIFVKFQIVSEDPFLQKHTLHDPVYLVAWTTTPWTIPSNFALAVNPDAKYVLVKYDGEQYIVAKDRVSYTFSITEKEVGTKPDNVVQLIDEYTGSELAGITYTRVYDFFPDTNDADFHVYTSDAVVLDEGSGVLHIAPAFGEVDFAFGIEHGISDFSDIDDEGKILVGPWKGMYLRDACGDITEDLEKKGNLLRSMLYVHRLPFYRGENPLIYKAQDSYFINIQKIKGRMLALNEKINWVPEYMKEGRFAQTIETSPDWCISRNRYWGTIMPIWKSDDGEELVIGSIGELMEYTDQITKDRQGNYLFEGGRFDLHKDIADKIVLKKNDKSFYRVPEVLDVWMDSGSVPFAQYHYPFENTQVFENAKSADYVIEYLGQIRAWFNVLLRLSTMIFDDTAFSNVICHGVLAGNDGRKMSKSYGNYPDPRDVLENIGGEALRLYFMGSSIMVGDDMDWSDELLKEQVKNVLLPVWNTCKYLGIYGALHQFEPKDTSYAKTHILDIWLENYMNSQTNAYAACIEAYNIPASVKLIQETIDMISSWYIRRSRDRFAAGDHDALQSLYAALVQFSKTFAPQMPFLTEAIYQHLVVDTKLADAKESVHLEYYPKTEEVNTTLLKQMNMVRQICSIGQSIRVTNSLRLRQPLQTAYVPVIDTKLALIIQEELHVKEVVCVQALPVKEGIIVQSDPANSNVFVGLEVTLSKELIEEGMYNDLVRYVQDLRKTTGLHVEDMADISFGITDKTMQQFLEKYKEQLVSDVKAKTIEIGDANDGKKVMIGESSLFIMLKKAS